MNNNISVLSAAIFFTLPALANDFGINQVDQSKVKKDKWQCEYCIAPETISGDWGIARGYLNDEQSTFQNTLDHNSEDVVNGHFNLRYRPQSNSYANVMFKSDNGDWLNPGLFVGIELGQYTGSRFAFSYEEQGHYYNQGSTPFTRQGNNLLLPDSWVYTANTQDMLLTSDNLNTLDNELIRKTFTFEYDYMSDSPWQPSVNYSQEKKEGIDLKSGYEFGHGAYLPVPISYQTDNFSSRLFYQQDDLLLSLSYHFTNFDNDYEQIKWQSPFNIANQNTYSLAPSSEYHQVTVQGRYRFSDTQLVTKASYGQSKQKDDLSNISIANPLASFDGRVDTSYASIQLSHRYNAKIRLTAKAEFDERNNKAIPVFIDDSFIRANDYRNSKLKLSANVKSFKPVNIKFGLNSAVKDRPQQERTQVREQEAWIALADRQLTWADVSVKYSYTERTGSEFQTIDSSTSEQNQLLRRFNLADKKQQKVTSNIAIPLGDSINSDLNLYYGEDDYNDTEIGLQQGNNKGADFALFGFNQHFDWQFFAGYQTIEYDRSGSTNLNVANFYGTSEETTKQFGFSMTFPEIVEDVLSAGIDYSYSHATIDELTDTQREVTQGGYPTDEYRMQQVKFYTEYTLSKSSKLTTQVIYERNDDANYFYQNAEIDELPNVMTAGAWDSNYQNVYFGFSFQTTL